jgi:glycosyltransferase involved in cell wall biosynthesis
VKILFVSCLLPYPTVPHAGGADLFHLIASLTERGHDIHLVSLTPYPGDLAHLDEMRPHCRSLATVVPALTWAQKWHNLWLGLLHDPLRLGRRAQGEMRAHIRRVAAEYGVDVIQFEWTETGHFVDTAPAGVVTVLDEVDVSFRPRLRAARTDWAYIQAYQARRQELNLCRRFDLVLTRSAGDRDLLRELLPGVDVKVLQPWTHVDRFRDIRADERRPGTVLFVGAMDRDENCQAVLWFHRHCWPLIRSREPRARLEIVGASPQPHIQELARDKAVTVSGYVPDLRAAYARSHVAIAPILTGGGVINKVIDAMAAGRPVVSTTLGNEGVAAPPGQAVLVADEPEVFSRHVLDLLHDDLLWGRIAQAGRAYVQQTYDWERNVSQLELLYRQHLQRKTGSTA